MKNLLRRSRNRKVIGGVCQGLSNYFEMDVSLWRILFIFGTIFTILPFVVFYIVCWIVIPLEEKPINTL